jgi:hypothetical protein
MTSDRRLTGNVLKTALEILPPSYKSLLLIQRPYGAAWSSFTQQRGAKIDPERVEGTTTALGQIRLHLSQLVSQYNYESETPSILESSWWETANSRQFRDELRNLRQILQPFHESVASTLAEESTSQTESFRSWMADVMHGISVLDEILLDDILLLDMFEAKSHASGSDDSA